MFVTFQTFIYNSFILIYIVHSTRGIKFGMRQDINNFYSNGENLRVPIIYHRYVSNQIFRGQSWFIRITSLTKWSAHSLKDIGLLVFEIWVLKKMFRQNNLFRNKTFTRDVVWKKKNRQFSSEVNLPKQADVVVVGKFGII